MSFLRESPISFYDMFAGFANGAYFPICGDASIPIVGCALSDQRDSTFFELPVARCKAVFVACEIGVYALGAGLFVIGSVPASVDVGSMEYQEALAVVDI